MKCLFVVNTLAGHYKKKVVDKKIEELSRGFDSSFVFLDENSPFPDVKGFERVVVFGGDGTLNSILNAEKSQNQEIIFLPIGTLNETAKNSNNSFSECLRVGERKVAYVFATGIFTPLGYNTKTKTKKRFKVFAYIFNVLKEYKIARISASIKMSKPSEKDLSSNLSENKNARNLNTLQEESFSSNISGEYALIMCIKAKSCFGFKFNKIEYASREFGLLLIKSPKHGGLIGKIELFFPLFRSFFIGFKKEYSSKNISFEKVNAVNLSIKEKTAFCLDGEKAVFENDIQITTEQIQEIKIMNLK